MLLSAAVVASACSDDDGDDNKKSNLESVKFGLANETKLIEPTESLQNSENEVAIMANSWIAVANGLLQYTSYLQAPSNATKSKNRITASNGRTNTNGEVLVYTWSDQSLTYAYQVSEESDRYVFEIFLKENGGDWFKYTEAEEAKDGTAGRMRVFDVEGPDASFVLFAFNWEHEDDGDFALSYFDYIDEGSISFIIDSNGTGIVGAYNGTEANRKKAYELIWFAEGGGHWTYYDEDEVVAETGDWE